MRITYGKGIWYHNKHESRNKCIVERGAVLMFLAFLLEKTETKDREKVTRLYNQYHIKLHHLVKNIIKDELRSEDIVHETYLSVIDNLDKINEEEQYKTWNYLSTIAKNKTYDYLKKEKRYLSTDEDMLMVFSDSENKSNTTEEHILQEELNDYLTEQMDKLGYPYKEVLLLKYYNHLRSKDIAAVLGLSAANVRQLQRRALKKLRELLEGF